MFPFLRIKKLFHTRNFSTIDSTKPANSFTVSYLINTCGLPTDRAISASKRVEFQNPDKPNSVLTLLKNHGFTDTNISQIVRRHPRLLVSNADKTLQPKLNFLTSIGLSRANIIKIVSTNPGVLHISLENNIIPSIAYIRKIVGSDSNVVYMLKRSNFILTKNVETYLATKFDILREHGVPDSNAATLLVSSPNVFVMENDRFKKILEVIKKLGFDPSKSMFCEGISRLANLSESTLEAKIGVYENWGWSEEDIYRAFKKAPTCIALAEEMINRKMDFLVNKMGFESLVIAKYPAILKYSLEKRIIPRCAVIEILISNGVLQKSCNLNVVSIITEDEFVKTFITRYVEKLPELLNVYQRKMRGL